MKQEFKIEMPQTHSVLKEIETTANAVGAAELEAVKQTAKTFAPPALRQAVAALHNTSGQRIKVSDGTKGLMDVVKRTRPLRKKGFAENMYLGGAAAGNTGRLERFLAIGRLRDLYIDYIPTYEVSGMDFKVEAVNHELPFRADSVYEYLVKPQRRQSLIMQNFGVIKIAVTTAYSEEARAVYKDAVADFLALQLSIEVMEAVNNTALASHLGVLEPITNFTFAPLPVAAPNIADLLNRMKTLEERIQLYEALNRPVRADLAIVPRDAYETLPLLKDGQQRRLYSGFEEAVPELRVIEHILTTPTNTVAVIRSSEFGLAVMGDMIIHTDRVVQGVGGSVTDTNMYYMTAELFVTPVHVLRNSINDGNPYGAGVIATIPSAYSLI